MHRSISELFSLLPYSFILFFCQNHIFINTVLQCILINDMEISPLSLLFFLKIIHVPLFFTYILVCLSISSKSPTGLYIYKLKWGYIYKLKQGKLIYSLYKVIPFKSLELALHLFRPLSLSIIRIFKFYLWKTLALVNS